MPFANPIIGGGGSLVYPSIHSPNYSPGVAGWSINKSGNAEFNNVVIRGTFTGTDYLISAAGIFQYSGTPAANNLQAAFIPGNVSVLDGFGNKANPGINIYTHDSINAHYWNLNIIGVSLPSITWYYNSDQTAWPNVGASIAPNSIAPLDQINITTSLLSLNASIFATNPALDSVSGELDITARTILKILNKIRLPGQATRATPPAGNVDVYANNGATNSHLKYVSDDGIDYATGRITAIGPNNQQVSSVTFVALSGLSINLGTGIYKFRAAVQLKANANAGQWILALEFSGTASVNYGFRFTSAAGVAALNANVSAFNSNLGGPATSVLGFYWAEIEGEINVSAAGALSVSGMTTVGADTFNVFLGSTIEAVPVV